MSVTDAGIALLGVFDKALPPDVRCMSSLCRYRDDVLVRNYVIAAHVVSSCNTSSVSKCAITYLKLISLSGNTNTHVSQWEGHLGRI